MSALAATILVAAAGFAAYRGATARGEWSWTAFAWTLLLICVFAACVVGIAVGIGSWMGPDRAALATGLVLLIIATSLYPLARVAKWIQKHDRNRA